MGVKDTNDNIELRSEEVQEILGSSPYWIVRWGITLIAFILLLLLAGSAIFKYPDMINASVTLTGTVPPAEIVSRSTGKLHKLYIKDNQHVKRGDYLAVIENTADEKDIFYLEAFLDSLPRYLQNNDLELPDKELNIGDIQSLYSSFYTTLFNYIEFIKLNYYPQKINILQIRLNQYKQQYDNISRQQKIVREQLLTVKKQYERDSLLMKKKILSPQDIENTYNQYLQSRLSLENMTGTLGNMNIQITQIEENIMDISHQYTEEKNKYHIQINSLVTQLQSAILSWKINYVLSSPIDGKVTFTNYWTENQNIVIGNIIFNVIPEDTVEIMGKANLPIARSGKVKAGQKVNLHFDNFPDNEFGIVKGYVQNVSLVPAGDNYILDIKLSNGLKTTYNKTLPYYPEMKGQANIITDDISLLERFIMPIKKVLTEN